MKRTVIVVLSLLAAVLLTFPLLGQTGTAPPTSKPPSPPAPLVVSQVVNIPYSHGVWNPFSMIWHEPVGVDRFDQSNGQRLRQVRVKFRPFWAIWLDVENTDALSPCSWTWTLGAQARLMSPNGTLAAQDDQFWAMDPWLLMPFDGIPDFHGPSGHSELAVFVGPEYTTTLVGAELRAFVGSGQTFFDLQRLGFFHFEATTGNAISGHRRTLAGTLTVEYLVQ